MTDSTLTAVPPAPPVAAPVADPERGLWGDAWSQLRRRPLFIIACVIIFVMLVMAFFPSLFTSTDPRFAVQSASGAKPSADAWFGRDLQGRDVFARCIYGAAPTIAVAVLCTLGTTVLGSVVGLINGYLAGWVDSLLSRVAEVFAALPFVLGAIVVLQQFNPPGQLVAAPVLITEVVVTIVLLTWPVCMRIMRAATIEAAQQDYVRAARALGAGPVRIVLRHILPNALSPVLVYATIALATFVSAEATLSFLGLGLKDPVVSWGVMISESQERIAQYPHALFFPAAFLVVTVLAFVMLGDAVRDALDPRGR